MRELLLRRLMVLSHLVQLLERRPEITNLEPVFDQVEGSRHDQEVYVVFDASMGKG